MNLVKPLLFITMILSCPKLMHAQKFGHIDYRKLIDSLDESKVINSQLEKYQQSLQAVGLEMVKKFQDNYKKYQSSVQSGNINAKERTQLESDLEVEQNTISNYQNSSKESLQKRNEELLRPFLAKLDTVIKNFGKQEGYQMIFDSSLGVIVSPDSEDLFTKLYIILNKK